MANLVKWIKDIAGDEQIEGVVIGELGWGDYGAEDVPNYAEQPRGKLLSWDDAKKWIDYDFSSGYGHPECNAIYVWTESRIIFVGQYDGATFPIWLPRNPIDIMPDMPGG